MADLTALLRELQAYERELRRHSDVVHERFQEVERSLARLSAVYEGTGARAFKEHWSRTRRGLRQYEEGTRQIARLLNERIDLLGQADRVSDL